jgi:hypothetical protein
VLGKGESLASSYGVWRCRLPTSPVAKRAPGSRRSVSAACRASRRPRRERARPTHAVIEVSACGSAESHRWIGPEPPDPHQRAQRPAIPPDRGRHTSQPHHTSASELADDNRALLGRRLAPAARNRSRRSASAGRRRFVHGVGDHAHGSGRHPHGQERQQACSAASFQRGRSRKCRREGVSGQASASRTGRKASRSCRKASRSARKLRGADR